MRKTMITLIQDVDDGKMSRVEAFRDFNIQFGFISGDYKCVLAFTMTHEQES